MSVNLITKPNVVLLRSPQDTEDKKVLSAKAAKFCTSPDNIEVIMQNDTNDLKVLEHVVGYGHLSVLEMDWWVFGIENVSRIFTHQLVRKKVGVAYSQESMRYTSQNGIYSVVEPESVRGKSFKVKVPLTGENESNWGYNYIEQELTLEQLASISHQWYKEAQREGVPNEDARFGLLEASRTKILLGINSHALLDFFGERCCHCAQWEIRQVAGQILKLSKEKDPIAMKNAGPKCHKTHFCQEARVKWEKCRYSNHIDDVKNLIRHGNKLS